MIFYRIFIDDIYNRGKLQEKLSFDRLRNYHIIIKVTIELNPSMFLDTKLTNVNGAYRFNIYNAIDETELMAIFIV